MTFTVAPSVRRIRYHDPDSLPVEDYFFTYEATFDGLLEDGTPPMELMRTSMRGSGRIRPGETALFALEAEPGLLSAALWSEAFFVFEISGERRAAPQTISVVIGPGACDPNEGSVTPGPVVINVRNETQRQAIFGIVQSPPRAIEHGMLTFWPFLSGKRLLMTQTFRDNFRSEISPVARPCGEWLLSAQPCPSCAFRRRSLQHRIADLPHRALTTVV